MNKQLLLLDINCKLENFLQLSGLTSIGTDIVHICTYIVLALLHYVTVSKTIYMNLLPHLNLPIEVFT